MKLKAVFSIAFFLSLFFLIHAQEKEILWSEDFEADWFADWHTSNGIWEVGKPSASVKLPPPVF